MEKEEIKIKVCILFIKIGGKRTKMTKRKSTRKM